MNTCKLPVFIAFLLCMMLAGVASAQRSTILVEAVTESVLPTIVKMKPDSTLELSHEQSTVLAIFDKYDVYRISKAYPTARTPFLQRIYEIEVNDPVLLSDLLDFPELFPYGTIPEDFQFMYSPNDYAVAGEQSSLDFINAKGAWEISQGSPDIVIGIIDTHIDTNHEDFASQIVGLRGWNGGHNTHGTSVAGCAAAATDNGIGISGIGFKSKILFSTNNTHNEMLILSQLGAKVLNASWAVCAYDSTADALYKEIWENGTTVVAGAGNGPRGGHCGGALTGHGYAYPASFDHVISVSSVGHIYDYGNIDPLYGPIYWKNVHLSKVGDTLSSHTHNDKVDICAPGYHVFTTDESTKPEKYNYADGTSFASPIVAGVCALMYSANSCLDPDDIKYIIQTTAVNIDTIPENIPYAGQLGAGRIDAAAAVAMAANYFENYDSRTIENETWASHKSISGTVTPNGAKLRITRKVKFAADAKIVVEPGGKLIIDGGQLGSGCMWNGIEVKGNKLMAQDTLTHGLVQIINGGKIQNARTAIRSIHGGIVKINNGKFINNRHSVSMGLYDTKHNANRKNQSYIIHSNFTCFKEMNDPTYIDGGVREGSKSFISITQQDGIRVFDNHFEHTFRNRADLNGTGIVTWASRTNILNNTFVGLTYGVEAGGYQQLTGSNLISGNTFDSVALGITETGQTGSRYYNNDFTLPPYESSTWLKENYGIRLDGSTGFIAQNNSFVLDQKYHYANTYGVISRNTNELTTLLNYNTFNHLEYATQLEGDNPRIDISCNNYLQSYQDWSINPITVGIVNDFGVNEPAFKQVANLFPENQNQGNPYRNMRLNENMEFQYFGVTEPADAIPQLISENITFTGVNNTSYNEECTTLPQNPCGDNPSPCVEFLETAMHEPGLSAERTMLIATELIRQYADSGMVTEMLAMLDTLSGTTWDKVKLPIYIAESMYQEAGDLIGELPASDYKTYMEAMLAIAERGLYIDSLNDHPTLISLTSVAGGNSTISAAARKVLELFYGEQYIRQAERWNGGSSARFGTVNGDNPEPTEVVQKNTVTFNTAMKLYPNPTQGGFSVQIDNNIYERIQVVDVTGRVLLERTLDADGSSTFAEGEVPAGIYLIRSVGGPEPLIQRIIILD
jgi:hypothetical protein